MEKICIKSRISVIIFALFNIALAQFGTDVRVDDASTFNMGCLHPKIVCGLDSILYVVWDDDRYSMPAIYFSKSTDAGNTWTPSIRVDDNLGYSCRVPCLVTDPLGNLYSAWTKVMAGGYQIRFSKSTNGGTTWEPSVRVDNNPDSANAGGPDMLLNDSNEILVVWACDSADTANWKCYFSKSSDGGNTWSSDVGISSYMSTKPKLVADADTLYAVYMWRAYLGAQTDIYLSKSTDCGETWAEMGRVNDSATNEQKYADITIAPNGTLYCAWYDWRNGNCDIYFSKSTDGGNSWSSSVRLSDISFNQNALIGMMVNIECFGEQNIHCGWIDGRLGDRYATYYSMSSDGGSSWIPNIKVNDVGYVGAWYSSMCLDEQGNPCLVWPNSRDADTITLTMHIYFDRGEFQTVEEVASNPFNDPLLLNIYPNPFKNKTDIVFSLGHNAEGEGRIVPSQGNENPCLSDGTYGVERMAIDIYDITGHLVKTFKLSTAYSIVPTVISWDGKDEMGNNVPSGVYICECKIGDNYKDTKKIIKLK